jgi:hypothetical protein
MGPGALPAATRAQTELSDANNAEPAQNLASALLKKLAIEIRNLSHRIRRDLSLKQESIKRAARITMAYAEARSREPRQTTRFGRKTPRTE